MHTLQTYQLNQSGLPSVECSRIGKINLPLANVLRQNAGDDLGLSNWTVIVKYLPA